MEDAPPELDKLLRFHFVELVHREPEGQTDLRVYHLLLLVALRLHQLEKRHEQPEVAEPAVLVVKLFALGILFKREVINHLINKAS